MPTPTFGHLNSPRGAVQAQNWDWNEALLDWIPSTGAPVVGVTGPISIANGADVAEGATTDIAVVTDTTGTISGKLRGLVKWAFERMPAALGQAAMSASLPVAISSDQSAVPITAAALPLPSGAATQATLASLLTELALKADLTEAQPVVTGMSIPAYDYTSLGYTGDNLTSLVFKTGGSGGTTVATLTLGYTGAVLNSITKS